MILGPLRMVLFLLAVAAIPIWVAWACQNTRRWAYIIPPVSWLLNLVILEFLVLYPVDGVSSLTLQVWRVVVLLHGVLLAIGLPLASRTKKVLLGDFLHGEPENELD